MGLVVHLSDLHLLSDAEEQAAIIAALPHALSQEQKRRGQPVELLAITGDIFDFDPAYVEDGTRRLGALRARHGVYAILGNHDVYTGAELVADALRRNAPSVRLLRDDYLVDNSKLKSTGYQLRYPDFRASMREIGERERA